MSSGRYPSTSVGTGATDQLAVWSSSTALTGSSALTFSSSSLNVTGQLKLSTGNLSRPDGLGVAVNLGDGTNAYFGVALFRNAAGNATNLSISDGGEITLGASSSANILWTTDGAGNIGNTDNTGRPGIIACKSYLQVGNDNPGDVGSYLTALGGPARLILKSASEDQVEIQGIDTKAHVLGNFSCSGFAECGGNLLVTGNISTEAAGSGLKIKEGSNARMGTAVLVGGTVSVSNTSVTANTRIFLTAQAPGGTPGAVYVSARVASTSFAITSTSGTDTSTVAWLLVEPT